MERIYVDAGHGGADSGAVGPAGTMEKDRVLEISLLLKKRLEEGTDAEVVLTRTGDEFILLGTRAAMANARGAALFLSIHANAGGGHGFEAFTSPGETRSDEIAEVLLGEYARSFPERWGRYDLGDGDRDKEARFTVLTATAMPAVLFEVGFIDHREEERWLAENQQEIAEALYRGVVVALELAAEGDLDSEPEEEGRAGPGAAEVEEWRRKLQEAQEAVQEVMKDLEGLTR